MAALTDLPYELLVLILTHCPTIQTALALSSTEHRIHRIWQENTDRIASSILVNQIPDYDEALFLALLEARSSMYIPEDTKVPGHLWLPLLFKNARFASFVNLEWMKFLDRFPGCGHPHASIYRSYYTLRQVVISACHDQYQPKVFGRLYSAPLRNVRTTDELYYFLEARTSNEDLRDFEILGQGTTTIAELAFEIQYGEGNLEKAWNLALYVWTTAFHKARAGEEITQVYFNSMRQDIDYYRVQTVQSLIG